MKTISTPLKSTVLISRIFKRISSCTKVTSYCVQRHLMHDSVLPLYTVKQLRYISTVAGAKGPCKLVLRHSTCIDSQMKSIQAPNPRKLGIEGGHKQAQNCRGFSGRQLLWSTTLYCFLCYIVSLSHTQTRNICSCIRFHLKQSAFYIRAQTFSSSSSSSLFCRFTSSLFSPLSFFSFSLAHFRHHVFSTLLSSHGLKGQCHEIFCFWFFSWIIFPPAPEYSIETVSKIRRDIRSSRFATSVNDTPRLRSLPPSLF